MEDKLKILADAINEATNDDDYVVLRSIFNRLGLRVILEYLCQHHYEFSKKFKDPLFLDDAVLLNDLLKDLKDPMMNTLILKESLK